MTMNQVERAAQVKWLLDRNGKLWRSMGAIILDGAKAGSVCLDLELLMEWQNEVFVIGAGIGPLAWECEP